MARVFGVSLSCSTVLRLTGTLPGPEAPSPRVVGFDEYAQGPRLRHVPIDCEARCPVDLLPDREASSLAEWPAKCSGIEVVCRDRLLRSSGKAPQPGGGIPVAPGDWWHLVVLVEAHEVGVADV